MRCSTKFKPTICQSCLAYLGEELHRQDCWAKGVKPWEREGYTSKKKKNKKARKSERKRNNAARRKMPENQTEPFAVGMDTFVKICAAVKGA